jgi:hypothetical protein
MSSSLFLRVHKRDETEGAQEGPVLLLQAERNDQVSKFLLDGTSDEWFAEARHSSIVSSGDIGNSHVTANQRNSWLHKV